MRVKIFAVFLLLLLVLPNNVRAECDNARRSDLSSIAGNVKFSTTYRIENERPVFTVEISNLTDDIYVIDGDGTVFNKSFNTKDYYYRTSGYVIYSNDPNCYGEELSTRNVNIPYYNEFSSHELCQKNPGDDLCKIWGQTKASTEKEFLAIFAKEHSNNSSISYEEDEEDTFSFNIYILILILITFLACSFILLFVVRRKKNEK